MLAPHFAPTPLLPIGESEDLDILGDSENFTIQSVRIPILSIKSMKKICLEYIQWEKYSLYHV